MKDIRIQPRISTYRQRFENSVKGPEDTVKDMTIKLNMKDPRDLSKIEGHSQEMKTDIKNYKRRIND